MRVLVLGSGDLGSEVCGALSSGGASVRWIADPSESSVADALGEGFDVVCVPSREDAFPLRMALLVRHLDADVRLVVTIFDPSMAAQVRETIPGCVVTSVADIVAPC